MNQNNRPQKILEISSYPPPRAGWGIRVAFVKAALITSGHRCEVLNIAPESRKIPSSEYLTSLNGLDYVWKVLSHCLRGYRVHMHMNGDSPKGFILALLAEMICFVTFKRPVLTFHAGPYQKYFPQERAPLLTPVYKLIFGIAGRIICNNEAIKEKIAGYGARPEKITPIQAFSVQYLQYQPASLNGAGKLFMEGRKPLIASYVFFRPEFFIDRMIRAVAQLCPTFPGLGLLILGSDDGSQEIRELAGELGISDHLHFAGDLDHDTFLSCVAAADIFLRTPVKDGVCSSVLEALSLGVPVVASENGSRPVSVITYDHESIDDMARVLKETIENLPQVKKGVVKPTIRDTVADELAVLLNHKA